MHKPSQEALLEANKELFCRTSAIPVQNRLRYLIESNPDPSRHDPTDFLDVDELAFKLGVDEDKMYEVIEDMNVPAEMMGKDEYGVTTLMPGLDVVLKEELDWRRFCDSRDYVTIPDLSNYLGINYRNVRTVIENVGIEPIASGAGSHLYPKELAHRVRAEWMMFPPARDRKNKKDIENMSGKSGPWVEPRLDPAFHDGSFGDVIATSFKDLADYGGDYMRGSDRRITVHYGRPIVALVISEAKKLRAIESYGDTVRGAARRLGRDDNWVKNRTLKADFDVGCGRVSESEMGPLQAESELQRRLPGFSEDEMTIRQVARLLGVGHEVVEDVCKSIGLEPAKRRTKNNRIAGAYSREDRLNISKGVCQRYESNIMNLEAKLARPDLGRDEAHIAKINLGRMRKLHKDAVETYRRLSEDRQEVA